MTRGVVLAFALGVAVGASGLYAVNLARSPAADTAAPQAAEPEAEVSSAPPAAELGIPELPVALSVVPSPDGKGYAVRLFNETDKFLAMEAVLQNPTFAEERKFPLTMTPGATVQLNMQTTGWAFVSGETVRLRMDGYRSKELKIP